MLACFLCNIRVQIRFKIDNRPLHKYEAMIVLVVVVAVLAALTVLARASADSLADLRTFVLFVGYQRSGLTRCWCAM